MLQSIDARGLRWTMTESRDEEREAMTKVDGNGDRIGVFKTHDERVYVRHGSEWRICVYRS